MKGKPQNKPPLIMFRLFYGLITFHFPQNLVAPGPRPAELHKCALYAMSPLSPHENLFPFRPQTVPLARPAPVAPLSAALKHFALMKPCV